MTNYVAKVRVTISEDGAEKPKKKTEQYLVQDETPTAVEVTMTKFFEGTTIEWELIGVTKSNILNFVRTVDKKLEIL